MSLLIWPGAKFEMDTATGRHSFHLNFSMVLGEYICHCRTSRLRPIFSATSFHDVWTFNFCDYVLTNSTRRPRLPGGFLEFSFVYTRRITIFKEPSGLLGFVTGARSEDCSVTVEGESQKILWDGFLWNRHVPA